MLKAILSFLLAACFAQAQTAEASNVIDVTAHRGNRTHDHENTLSSFLGALEAGASSIEFDVHLTSDGVPVIYHDYALHPKDFENLGQEVLIKNLTLAEVKNIHFSTKLKLRNGEKAIPTLDEFFQFLNQHQAQGGNDILLHLEAKMEDGILDQSVAPELLAQKTLESIDRMKPKNKIIVRSFYWPLVGVFKKLRPSMPRILLVDVNQLAGIDIPKAVAEYQPVEVSPNYKDVTAELAQAWKKFGVGISPWTVNDFQVALNLIHIGVTGLATDNPDLMKAFLASHGVQAVKNVRCESRLK